VHCWTFRDEARFRPTDLDATGELTAFLDAGVDGVFADQPDIAVAARRSWMMKR
jgi:glycerophosphoryl diester phosphodiesterase